MTTSWVIAIVSIISAIVAIIVALLMIGTKLFRISKWSGSIDADHEAFKEFMKEIRADIKRIFERLPTPRLINSGSPLSLTEFGEAVAEDLGAQEWAEDVCPEIWHQVEEMEDYEVHDYCFDYVASPSVREDWKADVRRIAYERGTDTDGVYDVLAIVLRDEILEKRGEGEGKSTTTE